VPVCNPNRQIREASVEPVGHRVTEPKAQGRYEDRRAGMAIRTGPVTAWLTSGGMGPAPVPEMVPLAPDSTVEPVHCDALEGVPS